MLASAARMDSNVVPFFSAAALNISRSLCDGKPVDEEAVDLGVDAGDVAEAKVGGVAGATCCTDAGFGGGGAGGLMAALENVVPSAGAWLAAVTFAATVAFAGATAFSAAFAAGADGVFAAATGDTAFSAAFAAGVVAGAAAGFGAAFFAGAPFATAFFFGAMLTWHTINSRAS